MPKLKTTITMRQILGFGPCYDPSNADECGGEAYLPAKWSGTIIDILEHPKAPPKDKLWVVLREGYIDDKQLRLFAVWCAREALQYWDNPDPRSLNAINVAERFANGEATIEELKIAQNEATAAATASYAASYASYATTAAAASYAAAYASYAATASYATAAAAAFYFKAVKHLTKMLKDAGYV